MATDHVDPHHLLKKTPVTELSKLRHDPALVGGSRPKICKSTKFNCDAVADPHRLKTKTGVVSNVRAISMKRAREREKSEKDRERMRKRAPNSKHAKREKRKSARSRIH